MNNTNGISKISQWQSQALGQNPTLQSQSQSLLLLQSPQLQQDQSGNLPQLQLQGPGSGFNGSSPLANYTLPGVISYLTSEFTHLERFKIMTNLEKSEMKYRITHLQGEINSLKLINEQQKLKIQQLENENQHLREEHRLPDNKKEIVLPEIPDIDLQLIKDSRYQLTKSMKEVIHLLRSPTNTNLDYLELPNVQDTSISFDELLHNDEMMFGGYHRTGIGKSKRSAINEYFNNDDVSMNGDSISEKFDSLALSETDDRNLESDVETVVLDGQNKYNDDGTIEPDLDIADDSDSYVESKIASFKVSELQISDPDYNKVRVFNNPMSSELLYLHYDHKLESENIKITLYDTALQKPITSMLAKLALLNNIEDILNLHFLSFDKEEQKLRLLAVNKTNDINEVILCGEESLSSLVISVPTQKITSSSLIRFDKKKVPRSKAFGLAITLLSTSTTVVSTYEIIIGPRDSIEQKELGSYPPSFFSFKETSDDELPQFQILKWFIKDHTTNHKKPHKKLLPEVDPILAPYNILVKLNNSIYLFNVFLKQFDQITDYSSNYNSKLEGFNSDFLIENGTHLTYFDLNETSQDNYTRFDLTDASSTAIFTSIPFSDKTALIEVDNGCLKLYDDSFNSVKTYEIQYDDLFRVGGSIIIQQNSTLQVYTLS